MQHDTRTSKQPHLIVGRAAEVAYLEQCLAAALGGERQVIFVSGEPGIGKTTIVEAFLQRLQGTGHGELGSGPLSSQSLEPRAQSPKPGVQVGRGQCIEQYGAGEAFMPLLEIAGQLCRGPNQGETRELLRRYAPSWLVQLPFLINAAELEALQRQLHGVTRERMLREAAEILTVFTQEQDLVMVLEDLHWSDVSTLEWLSYIAQRRESAKLLIIGTYRPTDVLASGHPLRGVIQELTARNRCEELRVLPLSKQSVSEYLSSRFSPTITASPLPGLIHRRTGGNPLFVVNVVDDLRQQGLVREEAGQWQVQSALLAVTESIPETLRQVIARQVERLPAIVQHLLEVASVVGVEFSAAAVAAGLQATVEEVDQHCETLVRHAQFIDARGSEEWPDGTLSERYSFRHALYHAALYDRLTETQRVRLHRRIAERKESAYGQRVSDIAAELALHCEEGRLYQKAVDYCQLAGGAALQRYARHEAATLLTKGLQLFHRLPDSPDRLQQELEFNVTLGTVLIGIKGYAAPETERAYRQAWELCQQLGDTPQRFPVLDGLRHYYAMRGEQQMAYRIEDQLLTLAQQAQDPALMLWAHGSRGVTLLWLGAFAEARTHLQSRLAFYESYKPRVDLPRYGDPAVIGLSHLSLVLWMLGYPDQAVQRVRQALALAQQLEDAFNIAYAQANGGLLYQHRRDSAMVQELSEAVITLATDHGLPFWLAAGQMSRGWALGEEGRTQEGIQEIEYGIQAWRATGAANAEPYFLTLLAEGQAKAGHTTQALVTLTQAIARMEQTEERCWEAELHRLQGELLLAQEIKSQKAKNKKQNLDEDRAAELGIGSPSPQVPRPQPLAPEKVLREAEASFLRALEVTRKQQAKSLELRAATSLARLWHQQGKRDDARDLLQQIYDWFSEGFDTKDFQEAEALLVTLSGTVKTEEERQTAEAQTSAESRTVRSSESKAERRTKNNVQELLSLTPQSHSLALQDPELCTPSSFPTPNTFRHEGDYWTVTFAERTCRIRDTLGMRYLAQLLRQPSQEIHVLTLAAEEPVPQPSTGEFHAETMQAGFTDAGEVLDPQAKAAYRQRLRDLQDELSEAQEFNDSGRIKKLQDEIEFLTQELAQAVGLGGRTRKAASVAERARVNVTKRLKIALRKISEQHPTLGDYLRQTIRTGTFCEYMPLPHQPVTWED